MGGRKCEMCGWDQRHHPCCKYSICMVHKIEIILLVRLYLIFGLCFFSSTMFCNSILSVMLCANCGTKYLLTKPTLKYNYIQLLAHPIRLSYQPAMLYCHQVCHHNNINIFWCKSTIITLFQPLEYLCGFVQFRQAMEWFGCGALGPPPPPPHIPLDGYRSTTTVSGVTFVMTSSLVSLRLVWFATSWDTLEPPASPDYILIGNS